MSIYEKLKEFLNLSFKNISLLGKHNPSKDNSIDILSKSLYTACVINDLRSIDEFTKKILLLPNTEAFSHVFNTAVSISSSNDNLDAIRYFINSDALISSETVNYIDIGSNTSLVQFACKHNNADILHYLITSPSVKNKLNIHENNDELFIYVCQNNYIKVAQYLIFEQHINKTENIDNYFKKFPNNTIEKMFELRDLNESLAIELGAEKVLTRKSKL